MKKYAEVSFYSGRYYGVEAYFSVWHPTVCNGEASFSQVWISSSEPVDQVNTMEAGWMVS